MTAALSIPTKTSDTASTQTRLEIFLEEHGRGLRRKIAQRCPRRLGIEPCDIEQDVRLRLWRVLQRQTVIQSPDSYLHRVINSAIIDAVRRTRVRQEEPLDIPGQEGLEGGSLEQTQQTSVPAAEHALEHEQLLQKVLTVLGALSEDSRQAIALHLQGFTSQEIATTMGWTEPRARHLAHRGLHTLRGRLGAER